MSKLLGFGIEHFRQLLYKLYCAVYSGVKLYINMICILRNTR